MTDKRRMAPRAAPDAPSDPPAGEGEPTPRKRMDYLTRACVLRLREGDDPLSCEAIAQRMGISESSVRRIVQAEAADHKAGIRRLMRTGDIEQIDNWAKANRVQAKKGYFQGPQAWLQATDAIEAKPTSNVTVDARPTIVLTMPFTLGALQPAPEPKAIEAQVVPGLKGDAL